MNILRENVPLTFVLSRTFLASETRDTLLRYFHMQLANYQGCSEGVKWELGVPVCLLENRVSCTVTNPQKIEN